MSSAIPHITCGGNNGRTSRSATPHIDLRVWPGVDSEMLNPISIRQTRPKSGRADTTLGAAGGGGQKEAAALDGC